MTKNEIQLFQETIIEHEDHVFIKPICDFFEINYENQQRILKKHPVLSNFTDLKVDDVHFLDKKKRTSLPKQQFLVWILGLPYQICREDLREKFAFYQSNIFDYLFGAVKMNDQIRKDLLRKKIIETQMKAYKKELSEINSRYQKFLKNQLFIEFEEDEEETQD